MARPRHRRGFDARVGGRGAEGRARDHLARRVGTKRARASLLSQVELSRGRRARLSVGLGRAKRHTDGAGRLDCEVARAQAFDCKASDRDMELTSETSQTFAERW